MLSTKLKKEAIFLNSEILYICVINTINMETIRLEFQPEIRAKILELLSSFSEDELKIVQEDPDFNENKRELDIELDKIKNGTAKLYTFEELDLLVEETIAKYES